MGSSRHPLPEHLRECAEVPGVPREARIHGDLISSELSFRSMQERAKQGLEDFARGRSHGVEPVFVAISGGGPEGAYGAGLLKGWTESGDRPVFMMVTGISTGALSAPFAFLGPAYDEPLEEIYTAYSTKDLLRKRRLYQAVLGDSMMSTDGLQGVIAHHADQALVESLGEQQRLGRRCWVCTTEIDSMMPIYWSIGEIAASGGAEARKQIRKILLASASIPGAFPPVRFDVQANGQWYDELHVDGGATSQVFVYPLGFSMRDALSIMGFTDQRAKLYVIRNAKLSTRWESVKPRLLPIINRSVASMIRTQGLGDLYRIYLGALRDGLEFHFAHIPDEFDRRATEPFDLEYMRELFELGRSMARNGFPWLRSPPGYETLNVEVKLNEMPSAEPAPAPPPA